MNKTIHSEMFLLAVPDRELFVKALKTSEKEAFETEIQGFYVKNDRLTALHT